MRKRDFIIFFSIVLTLYALVSSYVFVRGWEAVPQNTSLRSAYIVVFLFLSLSLIVGRFLERVAVSWLSSTLVWIGSFWLAAFVYFVLLILALDLLRLVNYVIPFFPSFITRDYNQTTHVVALVVCASVLITIIVGFINALTPRVTTLTLMIPKKGSQISGMNIVVASDIHLGTIVCKARLERIVEKINELNPDLVLLPGDVVDEDLGPVVQQNLGETLRKIRSRLGVIAITGNHEYIGGVERACRYLVEHGITVLRDEAVTIDSMYLVGREDRSIKQFTGKRRKSLQELMAGADKNHPVILMDHQPFHLDEAVNNGVDLQISGHTHHGQLWPFNFVTKKVYELSWGYEKRGGTHIYVSSGVGTWGPPVRTGNRPEIVNIRLTFG